MKSREKKQSEHAESGPESNMSEIDKLIAQAQAAAQEAQEAVSAQEMQAVKGKKKEAEEVVARVEEYENFFAGLSADDDFILDAAYESVFYATEQLAGIARPEKINETIKALKKTEEALRSLSGVESKSDELIEKLEQLKKAHDKLFETVQAATEEALEAVKKKYRGKIPDLEKRFELLRESPLVRGIEQGVDTPEAREKVNKQEIEELLLRPSVEGRLKPTEKNLADMKERLAKMQEGYQEMKQGWNATGPRVEDKNSAIKQLLKESGFFQDFQVNNINISDSDSFVETKAEEVKERIRSFERSIARDHIAFEHNRGILEEVLRDEHSEEELSDAFVGLRTLVDAFRGAMSGDKWTRQDWDKVLPDPTNKLARKIFGYYQQYGANFHGSGWSSEIEGWTRAEQILGRKVSTESEDALKGKEAFARLGRKAFLESRRDGLSKLITSHRNVTPDSLFSDYDKYSDSVKSASTGQMVKEFYSDEGRFINRARAHAKVDAGLQFILNPLEALPKILATAGWKESKAGAFVEPGQKMALVDREYTGFVEQLSRPQVEAERAFDSRSPEGGFHVYTFNQAMDLLRRARRDAAEMIKGIDQRDASANVEKADLEKRVMNLKNEVDKLVAKLEKDKADSEAREANLAKKLEKANKAILEAKKSVEDKQKDSEAEVSAILNTLKEALKIRHGLFSGDKNLRSALEEILKGKESK